MSSDDIGAIRAAEVALAEAFEAPDHTAWMDSYTEDAIFVGPRMPAIKGRDAFLDAARALTDGRWRIARELLNEDV